MRSISVSLGFFLLGSCAGSPSGDVVGPASPAAEAAPVAAACTIRPRYAEPLLVDWSAGERNELTRAMQDGLVAVRYTCGEFRVATGCRARGSYVFSAVALEHEVAEIDGLAEVAANFRSDEGPLAAEVERGNAIDLVTTSVGKRSTTARRVTRDLLEGDCEGATHVVRSATIGAFATSSDRGALAVGGEADACDDTSPSADAPPEGCAEPIRLELMPILARGSEASPTAKGADHSDPCPEGFTMARGVCTPKADAWSYACERGEVEECEAQCRRGSLASCFELAYTLDVTRDDADPLWVRDLYAKTCHGGYESGCSFYAGTYLHPEVGTPTSGDVRLARKILQRGCDELGDPWSCYDLATEYGTGPFASGLTPADPERREYYLARTCDLGEAAGCNALAREYQSARRDPDGARPWFERSCQGGDYDDCVALGDFLAEGSGGHSAEPQTAVWLYAQACTHNEYACLHLGDARAAGLGSELPDLPGARQAWRSACDADNDQACRRLD